LERAKRVVCCVCTFKAPAEAAEKEQRRGDAMPCSVRSPLFFPSFVFLFIIFVFLSRFGCSSERTFKRNRRELNDAVEFFLFLVESSRKSKQSQPKTRTSDRDHEDILLSHADRFVTRAGHRLAWKFPPSPLIVVSFLPHSVVYSVGVL
jgi:hypothetical protein